MLNDFPEKTLFTAPFTVGQETLTSGTELFYRHLSQPHLKADMGLHVTKNYVEPRQRTTVGKVGNK